MTYDAMSREQLIEALERAGRVEETLRRSSSLLEYVFDNTQMLLAYLDRDFNFLRVNRAYAAAEGRTPDFFAGKNHFDLYPHAENEAIFRRVLETGEPYFVESKPFIYPANPERGVTYWDWSLQPVRDAQGGITGILLALVDRTRGQRARQALHESERRFRTLFEEAFSYMWLLTPDGVVTEANHAALDLYEDGHMEVVGHPLQDVLGARAVHGHQRTLRKAMQLAAQGRVQRFVLHVRRKGVVAALDLSLKPLDDETGRVVGIMASGRDISEQKELERAVAESSAEERYRIGRDLHDIVGQNLTGLAFLAENLREKLSRQGGPGAAEAEKIETVAKRTAAVTRSLAQGLSPVRLAPEGLQDALRELAEDIRRIFGIPCECNFPAPVQGIESTVSTHLYYIAREAVHNAARHAKPTRITIRLIATESAVILSIQDNGLGLPEAGGDARGLGLRIMRYRADSIGAVLTISRVARGGTIVICSAPNLSKQERPEDASRQAKARAEA